MKNCLYNSQIKEMKNNRYKKRISTGGRHVRHQICEREPGNRKAEHPQ